ncbi:MAG: D-glycerate dehydrogenase [Actinomycetota bacterium]|nr:D-glycerate dehydrogenase [Actinomycetota bacterium]
MLRLLVTRRLPEGALDPVAGASDVEVVEGPDDTPFTREQLAAAAATVDGVVSLITDRIDAGVLAAGKGRLRVVSNVAVGYDNIDVAAATEAGVLVCNTPGMVEETTADLAFALILAASRRLSEAEADLRAGRWGGWEIDQYLGRDIHGATLGLVGYGGIGRAVAHRARGFGMDVLHHTRVPTGEPGWVGDLHQLLARSDVVSLHVPLTEQTRHLIGRSELDVMKPTAVLVNTARGPVVDEEAVAEALEQGRIFAAGLDVFEAEPAVHPRLLAAPRAVLTPHLGTATVDTRLAMARMAVGSALTVLAGKVPDNAVNPRAARPS